MRCVIQRVSNASVSVDGTVVSSIGPGLLVLAGIENGDGGDDISYACRKILNLRIFNDDAGVMNRSVMDVDGSLLVVSQFTLHGDVHRGNRPSYTGAMDPAAAREFFDRFTGSLRQQCGRVHTGTFGADMAVHLVNSGPVTIVFDTRKRF